MLLLNPSSYTYVTQTWEKGLAARAEAQTSAPIFCARQMEHPQLIPPGCIAMLSTSSYGATSRLTLPSQQKKEPGSSHGEAHE
jgi:hypothetical protein